MNFICTAVVAKFNCVPVYILCTLCSLILYVEVDKGALETVNSDSDQQQQ